MSNVDYKQIIRDSHEFNVRDELKGLPIEKIREAQPKNGFSVCVLNLTGSLNVGNIIRTSVIYGADCVYIGGRHRYDRRSTVGCNEYIDIKYLEHMIDPETLDYQKIINDIVGDGYIPIFGETGGNHVLNSFTWPNKPCIVMGSEGTGLPKCLIKKYKNNIVEIPMLGVTRSLNVSNAAAIMIYDYAMKQLFK
jgi:tRNA G18 (ribose-2'-O)-methylase SpoU